MLEGIIYCAISPSTKKYYGYTLNLSGRKRRYIKALKKGDKTRFYDALRKYGIENFSWNIIEYHYRENKQDIHNILCEREIYWIEKDKTYLPEFGYNMTHGGDGRLGSIMSEETKVNLIKKLTGRTTERKGKSLKQEMVEKYNENGLEKYNKWIEKLATSHCKPILQFDKNNNFIREWSSILLASHSGFIGTNICACLKGKRKTHKKYIWRYK